eukprot:6102249-Pleurochrysis_carterae.AAC.1
MRRRRGPHAAKRADNDGALTMPRLERLSALLRGVIPRARARASMQGPNVPETSMMHVSHPAAGQTLGDREEMGVRRLSTRAAR